MQRLIMPLVLSLGFITFSGCATLLQPGPDRVAVNSQPEGAKVFLDGQPIGHTPMVASLNRASEGVIRLELEGHDSVTLDKDKVAAGWTFGNIILGGLIGFGVDLATHNQGKYSEDPVFVEMHKKTQVQTMKPESSAPITALVP